MALIHTIIKGGSDFFKSFKSENKKQLVELEKLEKKIGELQSKEKKQAEPGLVLDTRSFFKFRIVGLFILFIAYVSFQSLEIIYLILAAYIVSLAVEAVISFFEGKYLNRPLSILLAYFLLVVVLLGSLVYIIPFLITQLSTAVTLITGNVANIKHLLETKSLISIVTDFSRLPEGVKQALINGLGNASVSSGIQSKLQENINQMVNLGTTYASEIGSFAVNFVGMFFNFVKETAIVVTLAVLFSFQKEAVMKFIAGLGGQKEYKFIYMKLERIYKKLGIRLKSQLFLCLFIGGMMLLSFRILSRVGMDIPNKFSLALINGCTEIIPYFGPFLGGLVAMIVAFIHFGRRGAFVVLCIVLVVQRLENNVLIPLLMHKTLGVNPVVIFISMILGSLVIGFVGVLLAVPIAVIITMVVDSKFEE